MNDFNRVATTSRTSDDDTKEGRGVALSSRQRNVQQRLYHPTNRPGQAIGDHFTSFGSAIGALERTQPIRSWPRAGFGKTRLAASDLSNQISQNWCTKVDTPSIFCFNPHVGWLLRDRRDSDSPPGTIS